MAYIKNETLAQYIARLIGEKKLSGYEIERRAKKQISQSYFNRIKKGKIANPSPNKLKALAVGLGISEEELFAVVRGKSPDSLKVANEQLEDLISKFERLTLSKKLYAQALIDLLNREFERLLTEI